MRMAGAGGGEGARYRPPMRAAFKGVLRLLVWRGASYCHGLR
jgi:hypothetical protein